MSTSACAFTHSRSAASAVNEVIRMMLRSLHDIRGPRSSRAGALCRILARMKPEKQTVHYSGRVVTVTADDVVLPNGHRATLEVVHHPGGAAVVALDDEQRVCLLRQFRYVTDGWVWELPA